MNNHNGLQNGLQQPMFAPVSQTNKLTDDIDLSDIFAEYLNDGATDPLTTFSTFGSMQQNVNVPMSNPPAQAAAAATMMLPTGGIRTAFHTGTVPTMGNQQVQQQVTISQQQVTQQDQHQLHVHHPQIITQQPEPKRAKFDDALHQQQQFQQVQQVQQQAVVPSNIAPAGSGITGRLGYSVMGGQLTMPAKQTQPAPVSALTPAPGGVQLPIGVGIRLGGVAPQAAHVGGGVALSHVQYGANRNVVTAAGGQMPMWAAGNNTTGGLSDQAMAERRQRNREHAKRSRVRKKFLLESLQAEVRELQSENQDLRMVIQSKIPDHAQMIISECCSKNPLFDDATKTAAEKEDENKVELVNSDFSLIHSLTSGQQNFVLSDPRLPDNPIVYASDGFYQLTGYTREQVLGRNCRFLQGPGTDPKAVDVIRTAVANGTDATTCLLNYKADGTPFWNQFFVAALRDSDNCIVNYVGVQCAVDPEAGASALEDKVNSVLPLAHKEGEEG